MNEKQSVRSLFLQLERAIHEFCDNDNVHAGVRAKELFTEMRQALDTNERMLDASLQGSTKWQPSTPRRSTIRRMLYSVDEALSYPAFIAEAQRQAGATPIEIEEDGTRYRSVDCQLVPAVSGTLIYAVGIYEEIEEIDAPSTH